MKFLILDRHNGSSLEMKSQLEALGHEVRMVCISHINRFKPGFVIMRLLMHILDGRLIKRLLLFDSCRQVHRRVILRCFFLVAPDITLRYLFSSSFKDKSNPFYVSDVPGTADRLMHSPIFRREIERCDYLACGFPPSMVLLIAELARRCHKKVFCMFYHRFNIRAKTEQDNKALKQKLLELRQDSGNIFIVPTEYEYRYSRYFLPQLKVHRTRLAARYLHSPPPNEAKYNDIVLVQNTGHIKRFINSLQTALDRVNPEGGLRAYHYRQVPAGAGEAVDFSHRSYPECLRNYRAMIFLPYSAYSGSLIEAYRLNIPIFAPSLEFTMSLPDDMRRSNIGMDRALFPIYCSEEQYRAMEPDDDPLQSPNSYHPEALRRWLPYMEIYQRPHIILFDSYEDLAHRLSALDQERTQIQTAMREENLLIEQQTSELYATAIEQASSRSTA